MKKRARAAIGLFFLTVMSPASAAMTPESAGPEVGEDNMRHAKQFFYKGGTGLASSGGRLIFSAEAEWKWINPDQAPDPNYRETEVGMHIFDAKKMKEVGFLNCAGANSDVEYLGGGLVGLSYEHTQCENNKAGRAGWRGAGMMIVNVREPSRPREIGRLSFRKSHTLTRVPGTTLIYLSGRTLRDPRVGLQDPSGPAIIDYKNPRRPKVVAETISQSPVLPGADAETLMTDCDSISFSMTNRRLGFCAGSLGSGEVSIWDVSDPLDPQTIGHIINPAIQYSHYATANHDGTLLAIADEAFVAHDCSTSNSPTGRVWIYDISDPANPIATSSFPAPRGDTSEDPLAVSETSTVLGGTRSWCASHGLDWHPNTNAVAVTWYTGGLSVLNLDEPLFPKEIAWFRAKNSLTYSTMWHQGLLYTNDLQRGLDVFRVEDLK